MQILRGFHHPGIARACAVTIGNFDGVHRGHQAMLALLNNEARHRGVPSCVLTFEPHPRDYFAAAHRKPELAPARIATLRDKLTELAGCGVDQCVILKFDARLSSQEPDAFITNVLVKGLGAKYVLVGDDFRFGAKRAGDYALLDSSGSRLGFDVARMNSYEVHRLRVSSSAVREALARGDMAGAATLLGRPYSISGHVVHGRKLGRELGFKTLNLRFAHWKPAAGGIFAVLVHGLDDSPWRASPTSASGPRSTRATSTAAGCCWRRIACNGPPGSGRKGAYGKIIRVELLHKLHDELRYDGLDALKAGIARDCDAARAFFASTHAETRRQTTRDRI
jgi:riboflavin kinase/FMN adenylyltransferase